VVDAPGNSIDVLLRIYTVTGRLVRTLKSQGGNNQVQLPWDGLDDERAPLANGVYLFKVNVNGLDSSGANSGQHASAEGRFVVLNR
jgi:flagellar hook assembly protein FlgD